MRHERLRFYVAAIAALGFFWGTWRGLEWIATQLGIPARIHYSPNDVQWMQIGDSWQRVEVGMDFTDVGFILLAPALMLTYYLTKCVYYLDVRRAFPHRRDVWLLAGWMVGPAVVIAARELMLQLAGAWGLLEHWPTATQWSVTVLTLLLARGFASAWGALMKRFASAAP